MEENLHTDETRLFDLIESTDYADLTGNDLLFVQLHITEEDYQLQRKIILASSTLFDSTPEVHPLNLSSTEEKLSKKGRTIPLYQALLAVASVAVFFLLIWPKNPTTIAGNSTVARNNPVVKIEKEIVHDTLIRYLTKVQIVEKTIIDTVTTFITETKFINEEPRLLNVSQSLSLPDLNKDVVATKGNSLKEDNSSRFILPVNRGY